MAEDLAAIERGGQVAFRYVDSNGAPAAESYPTNPNGSSGDVAGVTDASGRILGLMPHPEDHVSALQDPLRGRNTGGNCLPLFEAGVRAVAG